MPFRNYWYVKDEIQPDHYVLGDGNIEAEVLQPDADWTAYLPPAGNQYADGFESYCCVTEATAQCAEIILRRLFGDADQYSVRFLATVSGTAYQHGNSPHTVAEF